MEEVRLTRTDLDLISFLTAKPTRRGATIGWFRYRWYRIQLAWVESRPGFDRDAILAASLPDPERSMNRQEGDALTNPLADLTTAELIEELKGRAEGYGFRRSALGSPGIEFWFDNEEWDYEGRGH